jgi:exonuclease SbcD
MRVLHTSDIHLGRILYSRRRYEEFEAFLDWLAGTVEDRGVEALLIAGDIFDTSTPSNRALELYFRFLGRVARSDCRHVVIIAGNHDSPSFLRAPRQLLRALDVHVEAQASPASPADEVIVLLDGDGRPELIVGAVPYLRDRDIRTVESGESLDDKGDKLREGIAAHYAAVIDAALAARAHHGQRVPVAMMGHLFTAGGSEGEGVRDLYVGSIAHVGAGIFGDEMDYVALGHLHVPQTVGGREWLRYSGSPLAMGFGEAKQTKSVCLVDLVAGAPVTVELITVPVFQRLERVQGDWATIEARLGELADAEESVWLEVIYTGDEVVGSLRDRLDEVTDGTQLEVLRVKDARTMDRVLTAENDTETLDELQPDEVFRRLLATREVPDEQQAELWGTYQEAVASWFGADPRAE